VFIILNYKKKKFSQLSRKKLDKQVPYCVFAQYPNYKRYQSRLQYQLNLPIKIKTTTSLMFIFNFVPYLSLDISSKNSDSPKCFKKSVVIVILKSATELVNEI